MMLSGFRSTKGTWALTKVLITGMSGLIGGLLRDHLESLGGYELSALNRRPVEGIKCLQADIADLYAIRPAFEGIDVVVHLAAQVRDEPWEDLLNSTIIGTRNVYEAARLAGVKRVVFASSGNAIRGFEFVPPYDAIAAGDFESVPPDMPMVTHEMVRPQGVYGAAKVWGEALGRHYSDEYGLSILCVRIGGVPKENRPRSAREFSIYLSHRDIVNILRLCMDAPESLKYDIFLATSNNKWGYRDLTHAKEVLGYVPQDSADDFM